MSEKLEREERYIVFKVKDLSEHKLGWVRDVIRLNDIPTVDAVVVEADWPEYEPTWSAIERRVTGAQWNGEGLPPVGLEVECTYDAWGYWLKGKVLCYGEKMIFMEQESSKGDGKFEGSMNPDGIRFRPIRTPEQIAADERMHKIRNAHTRIARTLDRFKQDIPGQSAAMAVIEAVIDAGYEKQVTP
ncbi:hypothetical protein ACNFBR_07055 [Pseudomonas sp. NY11955]|uniref:hypothetical protein n=1 Tax=Pseudomonas sp. NY11955 TaxID=3400363 RepID=UPI003A85EA9F